MAEEPIWSLNTGTRIKGMTWWWWWWLFFIKNPENPAQPKQLMVLWSTKNCDRIKIDDYDWARKGDIEKAVNGEAGELKFNGVVGAWYFDGQKMNEELVLEERNMASVWNKGNGTLKPVDGRNLTFSGGDGRYKVRIEAKGGDFEFNMSPWTKFQSQTRPGGKNYIGKVGYEMSKIYGNRMAGTIGGSPVEGTAYFQKVMVNAPAVPWYWGMFHGEEGSYLEYFMPHAGLPCLRRSSSPRSVLDRLELPLSKKIIFFHEPSQKNYEFRKNISIKKSVENGLPTFSVSAKQGGAEIRMKLRAYSRACWTFRQKFCGLDTVLHYNEYPTAMEEFILKDGTTIIRKDDLGNAAGNTEHAWGTLA